MAIGRIVLLLYVLNHIICRHPIGVIPQQMDQR
jgi:hypothetical protein